MCGICGILKFHPDSRVDEHTIDKMANSLRHRGPDSEGRYVQGNVGFGFTRLSIIGLDNGEQPLYSDDRSVVLVCNGEIFNYKELRSEMAAQGYRFSSESDVEVIIPLYKKYGFELFHKLNGQFSFALYDSTNNLLFCGRDHVGITPFYYTVANGSFVFGSEIKAILQHPAVPREVDLTGLDQMFTFPGLIAPRTMFNGINSLPAGHYLVARAGGVQVKEYWDIDYPTMDKTRAVEAKNEQYYVDVLNEGLDKAVARRLQADVPVGFYISGGLDSSIIAAKIRQLAPQKEHHSFSIDFDDHAFSERPYQQLMAQYVSSVHNETRFSNKHISSYLRQAVYHSECPIKETYNTASLALSKMAADHKIKVVLSGEGADELFGGYIGYQLDHQRSIQKPYDADTLLENALRKKLWGDESFFYEKDYFAYNDIRKAIYSDALNAGFDSFNCLNFPLVNTSRLEGRHLLHKRSYLDFKLRLSDHLIADHGDRMAMAHSVEGRYPFLDKEVIELVARIPPQVLIKDTVEKYLLKKLAYNIIPHEVVDRQKFSFVAPGSDFLLKENIEWVQDLLSADRIKRQGYFNPAVTERLRKQYMRNDFSLNLPFDNDYLIIVLTFSIFLQEFNLPGLN